MQHIPVLLHETITGLDIHGGEIYLDLTIGGAGHALEACRTSGGHLRIVGIDEDIHAVETSRARLSKTSCLTSVHEGSSQTLETVLEKEGISRVDKILFDLGVSSYQLDESGRGFSFRKDEPLVMTLHTRPDSLITAEIIVNEWSEETLMTIIKSYGEERFARKIAHAIVGARENNRINTTFQLVDIITNAVPGWYRHGRLHPATRTFQAIRIATNNELEVLRTTLEIACARLNPHGRIAVISFHSLEDRIVKHFFKEKVGAGDALAITKKPIVPGEEEVRLNPRARSAKLRIIEKYDQSY